MSPRIAITKGNDDRDVHGEQAETSEAGLGLVEAGQLAEDDQQQLRNRDTEDQAGRQPPGEPVVVLPAPFGPRMCDLHRSLRLHGPSFAGGPDIPYLS